MANHAGYTIFNYPTSPNIKWWPADNYSEGYALPTNFENPLFLASQKLVVLDVWDNTCISSWKFQSAAE